MRTKNSNTPYFYAMMLATTAASSLPFFYRIIFYSVEKTTSGQEKAYNDFGGRRG